MKIDSIILRLILSIGVIVLLLIPLVMIQSLITERQNYRDEVVKEINKSWAASQVVAGPSLTVVTEKWNQAADGKQYLSKNNFHLLPEKINYETELVPETRYRGIYEVTLYKSYIRATGYFDLEKINAISKEELFTNAEKYISFNISDLRGIRENVLFKWNDAVKEVSPGLKDKDLYHSGFTSSIELDQKTTRYKFEITLQLNGSENLDFIPIGRHTEVTVKSTWNNPNFAGSFLPTTRNVNENGFTAKWSVNNFNRDFPQEWFGSGHDLFTSKFGVKLLIPVDEYQKTMRTSKYGIMIILLTFVSFFMIEIFGRKPVHPVQYLLIGLALVIFYSILLSLSEYILFQYSYIIAAILVIALVSMYTSAIYNNKKFGAVIGLLLFLFYSFMYVILQLQDYSLLLGNIALFIVIAVIMYITRKINWYEALSSKKPG